VRLRSSKTDQEARGSVKALPYGRDPVTCPPCAFVRWRELPHAWDTAPDRAARLADGQRNAAVLQAEIAEQGYTGGSSTLRRYLRASTPHEGGRARGPAAASATGGAAGHRLDHRPSTPVYPGAPKHPSDFPCPCIPGLARRRSLGAPPGDQPCGRGAGSPGSRA
jgi:hypothetical protein